MQIKLFKNEQLTRLTSDWKYWWPKLAVHISLVLKVSHKKSHFQGGYDVIK